MGCGVSFGFWSDEERWFVPRALGLGYSPNLKRVARKLGWVRPKASRESPVQTGVGDAESRRESRQDRLRRQADESKYEVRL
jgi:hypothetical protein